MCTHTIALIKHSIQKAFDTVNHAKLIENLIKLNFPVSLTVLIQSYLINRNQCVYFNNEISSTLPVLSGIPQGSVLGPVLFSIYVTSLLPSLNTIPCIKFADDTTFIVSVPTESNALDLLNNEIAHIDSWCKSFNMKLNKNKIICFNKESAKQDQLDNTNLSNYLTKHHTILFYPIAHNLKWSSLIDKTIAKLSSRLHILRLLKNTLTKKELIQVYNALIQSVIDLQFPIHMSFTSKDLARIGNLTKRAHQIICNYTCEEKCLPDMKVRWENLSSKLFTNINKDSRHILHPLLPNKSIRSHRFILPHLTSNRTINSFIIKRAIKFNNSVS